MATLGVVPFANAMTSTHNNKLQILQHSTNSVVNGSTGGSERREILILRKKPKPIVTVTESEEAVCDTPVVTTAATTVLVTSNNTVAMNNAGRIRKKPVSVGANLPRSHHQPPPVSVARRNARERNRVKQVNNGFATLRQHIPLSVSSTYSSGDTAPGGRSSKKLSKVETLRMAVDYIRSLQQLLSTDEDSHISTSRSPRSSDASSPTSLAVHSPLSPTNSSTNPSTTDLHQSYQPYEDDSVHTDIQGSPILLVEDDDTSLIDPLSPSPSTVLTSSFTPQYHRVRGTNTFIQLVNAQPDTVTGAGNAPQYEVDGNFPPVGVTSSLFPNVCREESYITSETQLQRLQAHHLLATTNGYQHPSSAELVILGGGTSSVSRHHPTSSLSPVDYSEQSLSPETSNVDDMAMLHATTSASFLPSFSTNLKSSSPTSTLHLVTSQSPLQLVASSTPMNLNATSVIHQQGYPANVELLSHVKMEGRLGQEDGVSEEVIVGNGQEVMDMMAWWEQEQRLRLVTSVATTATSTS